MESVINLGKYTAFRVTGQDGGKIYLTAGRVSNGRFYAEQCKRKIPYNAPERELPLSFYFTAPEQVRAFAKWLLDIFPGSGEFPAADSLGGSHGSKPASPSQGFNDPFGNEGEDDIPF